MRIALGQIDMGFEEKEKAMTLCSRLLAEAKEKQVDFVIFQKFPQIFLFNSRDHAGQ